MFPITYFVQECPICGRNLQVRLEYLGRAVTCQHCQGQFRAADPALKSRGIWDAGAHLLARVDRLLGESPASSRAVK